MAAAGYSCITRNNCWSDTERDYVIAIEEALDISVLCVIAGLFLLLHFMKIHVIIDILLLIVIIVKMSVECFTHFNK